MLAEPLLVFASLSKQPTSFPGCLHIRVSTDSHWMKTWGFWDSEVLKSENQEWPKIMIFGYIWSFLSYVLKHKNGTHDKCNTSPVNRTDSTCFGMGPLNLVQNRWTQTLERISREVRRCFQLQVVGPTSRAVRAGVWTSSCRRHSPQIRIEWRCFACIA